MNARPPSPDDATPGPGSAPQDPYRVLVESTSQVLWSASADGTGGGMDASKRWWAELTGQSVESQDREPDAWLEAVHPSDRPLVTAAWREAQRDAMPYAAEFRVQDRRGGWRRVSVRGVPVRNPDGTLREWFGTLDDVTAQREAEDALQLSEARYRALANAASEVVYRMNPDWSEMQPLDGRGLVASNRAPIRDWLQRNLPECEHERVMAAVRAAIADRAPFEAEHRVIRADGSIGWIHSRAVPMLDDAGEIVEWFGTARDITQRKETVDELRDIRSRMEAAMNVGAIGTWSWDIVSDRFYADASTARIFSLDPETVANVPLASVVTAIHPDDRPGVEARIANALAGEDYYETEYRVAGPAGTWRWVNARGKVERDAQGAPVRFPGVVIDITNHKRDQEELARVTAESERRKRLYETILSNTPDLAYVFDLDHRFIYANEVLLRLWGKSWEEAIGRTCLELGYEPWHAAMHDREIDQVVATREPIRGEVPFAGAFGRRIYDYIFVPIIGADGRVEAVAGTTRDVTERKEMEQTLRDADRRKDDFIALLAHELRNPLAPIRHGLQLLRIAQDEPETVATACAIMDRQLTHMVRLIDDLLDVSRVTRNKLELRLRRVGLAEVIDHAAETAGPSIRESGHTLSVELPGNPVILEADMNRLSQVFYNLLINSARYTPPPGRIHICAQVGPGVVAVTVEDNGVGIPPEAIPKVFDMFSQVQGRDGGGEHAATHAAGLGMGLALVKGLVEMHGGSVSVDSTPGQGSRFSVRLPLAKADAADAEHASVPARAGAQGGVPAAQPMRPSGPSGRRVLVVDDNRDIAESLTVLLRTLGDEVVVAFDGPTAVAKAESFRPGVILLDIGLPGMSGLDVARQIRAQTWGTRPKIIAMTGWGQDRDRERSTAAGFDAHLVKPVDFAQLWPLLPQPAGTDTHTPLDAPA